MVYLYALALGLPRRLAVRGIDGEPLRRFEAGEVIAIAGEIDRAPEPVEDALHTQDQVVRALHAKAEAPGAPSRVRTRCSRSSGEIGSDSSGPCARSPAASR